MSNLIGVSRITIPMSGLMHAYKFMREVGELGYEGLAVFVGKSKGSLFEVTNIWVPQQQVHRSEDGLSVTVGAEELHRINVSLYRSGLELIGQIHSHPTDAFHSDMDDEFAIANAVGAISIVVPDFAARRFRLDDCAVYRLEQDGTWRELSTSETLGLIEIRQDVR